MKATLFSLSLMLGLILPRATAQIPVTVNRSTVTSGGTVSLPSFQSTGSMPTAVYQGGSGMINFQGSAASLSSSTVNAVSFITLTSGVLTGSPQGPINITSGQPVTVTASASLSCTVATNAPSVFTNTVNASANYLSSDGNHGGAYTYSQAFIFTIVNDSSGGGAAIHTAALIGQADTLESISRKDTAFGFRKLLGFQLSGTTNATVNSIAVTLSSTSTNDNSFGAIALYQDGNVDTVFQTTDTQLATTTNANGFAIFSGLSLSLNTTNKTFFVAGQFAGTNQTKNSFLSASVNAQNIGASLEGTNVPISVTGGNTLGKQYAFLDTTTMEDDAAAAAIEAQIAAHQSVVNQAITSNKSGITEKELGIGAAAAAATAVAIEGFGGGNSGSHSPKTPHTTSDNSKSGYSEKY